MRSCPLVPAVVFVLCVAAVGGEAKPLVVFAGDSITDDRPTVHADYKPAEPRPSPNFAAGKSGYVEALVEATRGKNVPFRFDKLANGGQAVTGWIGIAYRQILEKRSRAIKELPAVLIVQDFLRTPDAQSGKKLDAALRAMAKQARRAGVRLIWLTATLEKQPGATWAKKFPSEHIDATNAVIVKLGTELGVAVIRMDVAWQRYHDWSKVKTPASKWRLTQRGKIVDGVHPGRVGSLFFALVIARELGIPAEQFDEAALALGVDKEQAAAIKHLVYSWQEPAVRQEKQNAAK